MCSSWRPLAEITCTLPYKQSHRLLRISRPFMNSLTRLLIPSEHVILVPMSTLLWMQARLRPGGDELQQGVRLPVVEEELGVCTHREACGGSSALACRCWQSWAEIPSEIATRIPAASTLHRNVISRLSSLINCSFRSPKLVCIQSQKVYIVTGIVS